MPVVQTARLQTYYEESGEGDALILIRGLGSSCDAFQPQVEGLASRFRVVAFDNRCVGRTEQPDAPFTTADMADDTAALLDSLGIRAAHVFGVSLGGMIAQELALRHPRKVRRLALGCTHAGPRTAVPAPEWAIQIFNQSRDKPREESLRLSIPILFAKKTIEEKPDLVEESLALMINNNQPKRSYLLQLGAVLQHDTFDRLGDITHPTLVLTGAQDALIHPSNSRLLASRIPGARFIVFEDTGHVFFTEKADEVNRVLIEFFAAKDGAGPGT